MDMRTDEERERVMDIALNGFVGEGRPDPLDWRGSRITIGCRVLYARDGMQRIGKVIGITTRPYSWGGECHTLNVRWQEDARENTAVRPPQVDLLRKGRGVLIDNVTVWPEGA